MNLKQHTNDSYLRSYFLPRLSRSQNIHSSCACILPISVWIYAHFTGIFHRCVKVSGKWRYDGARVRCGLPSAGQCRGSGHRHRSRRRGRHTAAILPSHPPSSILQLQPLSSSSSSRVCSLFFHFIRRMNTDVSHFEISCPLLSSILQYSLSRLVPVL